jgi:hypothetical protein
MSQRKFQLDYAAESSWYRRSGVRRCIGGGLTFAAVAVAVGWGQSLAQHFLTYHWQQECLAYIAPLDQVVYEQNPQNPAAVVRMNPGYERLNGNPSGIGYFPKAWERLGWTIPTERGAMLFMHERRSPAGNIRLVGVEVFLPPSSYRGDSALRSLKVSVFPARSAFKFASSSAATHHSIYYLDFRTLLEKENLRIFAGQPDPLDPSHFTIACEIVGWPEKGITDGWLQDDDNVKLQMRQ